MSNDLVFNDLLNSVETYVGIFQTILETRQHLVKFFHFGVPDWNGDDENKSINEHLDCLTPFLQKLKSEPRLETSLYYKELKELDPSQKISSAISSSRMFNTHFLQHASNINNSDIMKECKTVAGSNIKVLGNLEAKAKELTKLHNKSYSANKSRMGNSKKKGSGKRVVSSLIPSTSRLGNPLHTNKIEKKNVQSSILHHAYESSNGNNSQTQLSTQNHPSLSAENAIGTNVSVVAHQQHQIQNQTHITPSRKKTKRIPKKSKKLQENDEVELKESLKNHSSASNILSSTKEKMSRKRNIKKTGGQVQSSSDEKKITEPLSSKRKKGSRRSKIEGNADIHTEIKEKPKNNGKKRRRSASLNHASDSVDPTNFDTLEPVEKQKQGNVKDKSDPVSTPIMEPRPRPLTIEEQQMKQEEGRINLLKKEYLDKLKDPFPRRLTNPLLCLPPFPTVPNPSINIIPNGAEFWNLIDLYFPKPRSLPISTIASILGFDIPRMQLNKERTVDSRKSGDLNQKVLIGSGQDFDPNTVSLFTKKKGKNGFFKDPFQHIPPIGNFSQTWRDRRQQPCQKTKTVYNGDDHLDFIDANWIRILEQYRGIKSIEEMKLAKDMIHVQYEIPLDCIKLACERNLILKTITFRFAVLGDEKALLNFIEKTDGNDGLASQEITFIIKCESQRILIAESEDKKILSFVHYSFNWYILRKGKKNDKEDSFNDSTIPKTKASDKRTARKRIAELVTLINKVYSPANMKDKHNFNLTIVLLSLTIHHAQRSNVYYCIMEAPDSFAEDYARLFRMRMLPKMEGSEYVPLACDLVMISYYYTYYMMKEIDNENFISNMEDYMADVISERMIIRLPKAHEALSQLSCINEQNKGSTTSGLTKRPYHGSSASNGTIEQSIVKITLSNEVSGAKNNSKAKINKAGEFMEGSDVCIESSLSKENKSLQHISSVSSRISIDGKFSEVPKWKVLRIFPTQPNSKNFRKEIPENQVKREDSLVTKLKCLQNEMIESESSLELQLRALLSKVVKEEKDFSSNSFIAKEMNEKNAKEEYSTVLKRRKELQLAWEAQLEQDMDAVCDVCGDGEVTISNQILFCEACNVAVHQRCYGIETIPEGDYFCKACRYFNRDTKVKSRANDKPNPLCMPVPRPAPLPLPISCELCPRKQGAFVRTEYTPVGLPQKRKFKPPSQVEKWVHVLCAKWHGLNYIDPPTFDIIEDATPTKNYYKTTKIECILCKSNRGAFYKCNILECNNRVHVSCARSSGLCKIVHGTCYDGSLVENPWTLYCPDHSEIEEAPEGSTTIEQLILTAKAFPPEPKEVPKKPFWKMNGKERREYLRQECNEELFFELVMDRLEGLRCSVCNVIDNSPDTRKNDQEMNKSKAKIKASDSTQEYHENMLSVCTECGLTVHIGCYSDRSDEEDKNVEIICDSCKYSKEYEANEDFEKPQCHMCNQETGLLVKAFAKPTSKKKWQNKPNAMKKSLFGKQIWCHAVCGMWHPNCMYQNHGHRDKLDSVDCTNIVMADGKRHTSHDSPCLLCGRFDGAKVFCAHDGCLKDQNKKIRKPGHYHLSCARQAGLEVSDDDDVHQQVYFKMLCFKHAKWEFSLDGRIQELLDFERSRSGQKLENQFSPMTISHATSLLNQSVTIMGVLGWAWRWADWWVQCGNSRQTQESSEGDNSPESRCVDARKCRLAAFGAALRNRDYDKVENDNRSTIVKALRAILNTPSLVGSLRKVEIEFLVDWLARAYRYKSTLLGFGNDAIPVSEEGSCLHIKDKSKKFKLGNRPLPGKQILENSKAIFEDVDEVDDFLERKLKIDSISVPLRSNTPPPPSPLQPPPPPPPPRLSPKKEQELGKKRTKIEKVKISTLNIHEANVTVKVGNVKKIIRKRQVNLPKSPPKKGKGKTSEKQTKSMREHFPIKKKKLNYVKTKQMTHTKIKEKSMDLTPKPLPETGKKELTSKPEKKHSLDDALEPSLPNMSLDSFRIAKKKTS